MLFWTFCKRRYRNSAVRIGIMCGGRKCMLGRDIIPLLCRSSQHWGEVFLHHNPTSTVRIYACRRSVLCCGYTFQDSSLFGKNRQIEHSNFKGKYTTLFCKRVLKTWEKEKGIVRVNVTKRESFNPNRSLDYNMYILTIVWYCFLTSFLSTFCLSL